MHLGGMRMEVTAYDSRIDTTNFPEGLKEEEKLELLKKIRADDNDAKIKMIECHIKLTLSIVSRYVPQAPWKIWDLVGSALYGLTKAVNWVAEGRMGEHDNITGYIVDTVHRYISEFLETDHLVRIPRRSIPSLGVDDLDEIKFVYDPNVELVPGELVNEKVQYIHEILEMISASPVEMVVIRMRSQGYVDEEIAAQLGYKTKKSIMDIRDRLYARFKELYNKI